LGELNKIIILSNLILEKMPLNQILLIIENLILVLHLTIKEKEILNKELTLEVGELEVIYLIIPKGKKYMVTLQVL